MFKERQRRSVVFIINFEHISHLVLVFLLLTLASKCGLGCYISAQIPYLRKIWFLRYGPECSQPIRLQDFYNICIFGTKWWNSLIFYILIQIHENQKLIKKSWTYLTISQEENDGINWFFVFIYKFRKAKSYFNNFWVGMVQSGLGCLDHGTLKSSDLRNELMNWAGYLLINSFMTEVPIIWKPVHWLAQQINGLVSKW